MSKRVRVIGYRVQPEIVVDDGETLTPLPQPATLVPASEWPRVVEHAAAALAKLQAEIAKEPT